MKIDSLMVLAYPWSSLPMMLKLFSVILCPACCMCTWMGEGYLRCSLLLSPRVLAVSPMYSSLQAICLHWKLYMMPHFFFFGSWSLGFLCVPFEVYLYTILTTDVFETFHKSFCIWYHYVPHCGIGSWEG